MAGGGVWVMAIPGPGLGIVRFEYSGEGVVVARHV